MRQLMKFQLKKYFSGSHHLHHIAAQRQNHTFREVQNLCSAVGGGVLKSSHLTRQTLRLMPEPESNYSIFASVIESKECRIFCMEFKQLYSAPPQSPNPTTQQTKEHRLNDEASDRKVTRKKITGQCTIRLKIMIRQNVK